MSLVSIADLSRPISETYRAREEAEKLKDIFIAWHTRSQFSASKFEVYLDSTGGRSNGIHASESSGCMRPTVYSLRGTDKRAPEIVDPNMIMRFTLGKVIHAYIQHAWSCIAAESEGRITYEAEVPIHPGNSEIAKYWSIYSSCDGVIGLWDDDTQFARIGLEIKTQSDGSYTKMSKPDPKHLDQSTVYMKCLDLPLMWACYYNKSNSDVAISGEPYLFTYKEEIWEALEKRWTEQHQHALDGTLPERKTGMECSWCPYAWICDPEIPQFVLNKIKKQQQGKNNESELTRRYFAIRRRNSSNT